MKILRILSVFILLSVSATAQKTIINLLALGNRPILNFKNEITVGGLGEKIIAKKFFDDEDRMMTLTNAGVQFWNTKTAERLRSLPHDIPNLEKSDTVFAINPDATKIIVMDGFRAKFWGKKPNLPATVFSLETGREIAVLQRPENSIRRAIWSADGNTLVTFSSSYGESYNQEICFWDGVTLEFRGSINANQWHYLTRDGEHFITTSGITKNTFGFKSEKPNSILVWNTRDGSIEKTYVLEKENPLKRIRISDDERYLLSENDDHIILLDFETGAHQYFSAADGTSVDSARMSADKRFLTAENNGKILVWEIGKGDLPKFEITTPAPVGKEKLTTDIRGYNFDGRHLAINQMKYKKALLILSIPTVEKTEFYDLETGKLNPALDFFVDPNYSLLSADNKYAVNGKCDEAIVSDLSEMKELYKIPLECKSSTTTTYDSTNNESKTETIYYNDDIIAFHPQKDAILVVKDNILEIYGTNPNQKRLQLVFPPRLLSKGSVQSFTYGSSYYYFANTLRRKDSDQSNEPAGFLRDGDSVFAVSADKRSIFFWDVDKKFLD